MGGSSGCQDPEPFRQYHTGVACAFSRIELDDATRRIDLTADGALGPDDLSRGETVFILRVSGTHVDSQAPAQRGVSIHGDWSSFIERSGSDWVLHATADCIPTAKLTFSFAASDVAPGDSYEGDLTDFGFRSVDADATTTWDIETSGSIEGSAAGGTLSGVLDGFASGALYSEVPEEFGLSEVTGQTVQVEALAFHGIAVIP